MGLFSNKEEEKEKAKEELQKYIDKYGLNELSD